MSQAEATLMAPHRHRFPPSYCMLQVKLCKCRVGATYLACAAAAAAASSTRIVVQHAIAAAKRADTTSCGFTVDRSGAPRQQVPFNPDVCLANFYKPSSGRLGMHQDRDESAAALKVGAARQTNPTVERVSPPTRPHTPTCVCLPNQAGSPVLSISIGATADFAYSKSKPKARSTEPAEHSVKLESGDIL